MPHVEPQRASSRGGCTTRGAVAVASARAARCLRGASSMLRPRLAKNSPRRRHQRSSRGIDVAAAPSPDLVARAPGPRGRGSPDSPRAASSLLPLIVLPRAAADSAAAIIDATSRGDDTAVGAAIRVCIARPRTPQTAPLVEVPGRGPKAAAPHAELPSRGLDVTTAPHTGPLRAAPMPHGHSHRTAPAQPTFSG